MKKNWLYITLGVALAAVLAILAFRNSSTTEKKRKLDERVSFRVKDKIPYGTYVAYNAIGGMFPGAVVTTNEKGPGFWENLSETATKQALIIISPQFYADEYELRKLQQFVDAGNDVLISAAAWSYEAEQYFGLSVNDYYEFSDSLEVRLVNKDSVAPSKFSYAGWGTGTRISRKQTDYTTVLGFENKSSVNFVRMTSGNGKFLLHTSPFALTNYFIISNNNYDYYQRVLSYLSPGINKIAWDQYYLNASQKQNKPKGWFKTLMTLENDEGKRSFGTAFYILLALLLLYTLIEMRRKQRRIPVVKPPANDSLEFVKTIGRLYHEKGDHGNLARKMSAYFLEHVRNQYKLSTSILDENFVRALQAKSGADFELVNDIVNHLHQVELNTNINVATLTAFHRKLETFYKTS